MGRESVRVGRIVRGFFVVLALRIGFVPNRHLAAGSAAPSSDMSAAAVNGMALFLTRPHSLLLCRSDDGFDLLPFPLMNLLDLLPLLLD